MKINCSQYLPELFWGDFLVTVFVPVLEEAFYVESNLSKIINNLVETQKE